MRSFKLILVLIILIVGSLFWDSIYKKIISLSKPKIEKPVPAPVSKAPVLPPAKMPFYGTLHVKTDGNDEFDGTTPDKAKATIQAAVNAAGAGATVLVASGTYALSAPIRVERKVIVQGAQESGATVIDGQRGSRCFLIEGPDVTLENLTIQNGSAENTAQEPDQSRGGGGICVEAENCIIRKCSVIGNYSVKEGGGIYSIAPILVSSCKIIGNSAKELSDGGGAFISGGVVSNCVFSKNTVVNGNGGGIFSENASIVGCLFDGNVAKQGEGGGVCMLPSLPGKGIIRNCLIIGNYATAGGGVVNGGLMENCTVSGNLAEESGGGLYNVYIDKERQIYGSVVNSIVCDNDAPNEKNYLNKGYEDIIPFRYSCVLPVAPGLRNISVDPENLFAKCGQGFGPKLIPGDYHLASNSPCINAGTNLPWMAGAADMAGNSRIINGIVDIGAYEFDGKFAPIPVTAAVTSHIFYVSLAGDDKWTGKLAAANREKTDGPFRTLEKARDAIREIKQWAADQSLSRPAEVQIRKGVYYLKQPFRLDEQDSGNPAALVTYRAFAGEEVILSGGKIISGWQTIATNTTLMLKFDDTVRTKIYAASLPEEIGQPHAVKNRFEVYYRGQLMPLARWPNDDWLSVGRLVGEEPMNSRGRGGNKIGKFCYQGNRPKRWKSEPEIWLHGYWFHDWADERHQVESIDENKRIINILPTPFYHSYGYATGQWYYAFNLLSEIDSPGEWYHDSEANRVYFFPPGPLKDGDVVVPALPALVTMKNADWVNFGKGLILESVRGSAIGIGNGNNVTVEECTIHNCRDNAVVIDGGFSNGVKRCHIYAMGDSGVVLNGGDRVSLTPARHFVTDSHIHDYGRWRRMYSRAVALIGVGNVVSHNLIHDAPHQAISFSGNDHLIELNEIHHVCQEANDAGAIYNGRDWSMRGTVIRYNFFHHLSGFRDKGCVAVYLDDMLCGTLIFGNTIYKTYHGLLLGGGRDNIAKNNVLVDCKIGVSLDARAMGRFADTVPKLVNLLTELPYQKPPWSERYPELVNILDNAPAEPRGIRVTHNIIERKGSGQTLIAIMEKADKWALIEDNFMDTDPGFANSAKMDFTIKKSSFVFKHGFQPIPFESIGPRPAAPLPAANQSEKLLKKKLPAPGI